MNRKFVLLFILAGLLACNSPQARDEDGFQIAFEKFELDNGLDVIFHVDRSDPVVAVILNVHVGSAREKTGRTGFAHLFEHLLFLESENLGKGGLDKMSARIGGSGANGWTSQDQTNYFQTVPNDALEKMIWAEADKLGWFINTVTDPVLAKEKQVVKNEKRQGVDNRPYGHTSYVIDKNLYPEDHPYNWQVIGSFEDLQNATLDDVKEFYNRWYVPNNSTLVIAGDFDTDQAREWVRKYFDEIKAGEEVPALPKRSGRVEQPVRVYHEDNFANLPELTLVWPTVELFHPDSYPLEVLTQYLSEGKTAPFYKVLVEDKQVTSGVDMFNQAMEVAGQTFLSIRAFDGTDLDTVYAAIQEAFAKFEVEGITETDLKRIKAGQEMQFYRGLSSVVGKGFQLAQYNLFAGDPGFVTRDIRNILDVSAEDVVRVYNQYFRDRDFVATSFVPKGEPELALENSIGAEVVEESIDSEVEEFDATMAATYERTPSTFDRSVEPPSGSPPVVPVPEVWQSRLSSGMDLYGIENNEVPLVQLNMVIDGGLLLEDMDMVGVSNLLANMMTKGTKNRTPEELETAIELLGASINVNAGEEDITISCNTLAKNFGETMDLLEEILLEPRWDEKEFNLAIQKVKSQIQQQNANPNSIAQNTFNRLIYDEHTILSKNILGTLEFVESISMEDLKDYYNRNLSPSVTRMHVVGAVREPAVESALKDLESKWAVKEVTIPGVTVPPAPEQSRVYFYDVPGATQSVLRIGYPALAATDDEYYEAHVANYILGGGGFASRLTQVLREEKGYLYHIWSGFSGSRIKGPFTILCSVRSNITLEALELIRQILEEFGPTYTEQDLRTTKDALIRSNARAFETAGAKLRMLQNMSAYGWEADYVKQREAIVSGMTLERIRELSGNYLDADEMIWLVVGDAQTQLDRLNALGFGTPISIE